MTPPQPHPSVRRQPAQVFLAGGALLCSLAVAVLLLQPPGDLQTLHRTMAAACALSAALFAWFARSAAPLDLTDRVLVAAVVGIVLVITLAWQLGTGLRTIVLGVVPLLVGLSLLLAGGWRGAVVAVVAFGGMATLAWHELQQGPQAVIDAMRRLTPASGIWAHVVLLLGGLIFGLVARALVQRWRSLADARESQFRELLASAADRYMELDADLRFTHPTVDIPLAAGPLPPMFIGQHPWDTPGLQFDADQARKNQQDLLARRPFDIELTSQPDPQGPATRLAISGRPRRSSSGQFLGYWCVGRDITAQERQRESAEQAARQAQAASRAKSSLLANMSHEIRTPLNGILGLAQLARHHVDDRHRLVSYLDLISQSAATLHTTLSNVLDLSRAEAGRLDVAREPVDLPALLLDLHRSFAALCEARGIACTVHIDTTVPRHVLTDAVRLRQILTNYLHNALKFTPSGTIALAATVVADGRLRFEVQDSGCGISDADQATLFQAFTQVDASSQRAHGGSGLGLSICRELALAMGGTVGVSSRVGHGSRFWVELPLSASSAPSALPAADQALPGLRALVVEDNPVNMLVTVALLEHWGARTVQAVDGREAVLAVATAQQNGLPFDVVLMDLQMPDLDGLAAAREIRANGAQMPIVLLTASLVDGIWDEARAAGFDDALSKPVDVGRLHTLLARISAGDLRHAPLAASGR